MFVEYQSLPNCIAVYLQGVHLLWFIVSCPRANGVSLCVAFRPLTIAHWTHSYRTLESHPQVACSTVRDFEVPWWPAVLRFDVVFSTLSNPPTVPQTVQLTLFLTHCSLIALFDANDFPLSEISKNSFLQSCLASPCQPAHPYVTQILPTWELAVPDSNLIRYFSFKQATADG